MRSKMRSKKASLELSINTIVIVVLALTLLGLGLAFIRNQIMNISETTMQVQDQIKQQILDDLRTGNKKLSFPTNEITVQSQGQVMVPIGVKNTGDSELDFKILVYDITEITETTGDGMDPSTASGQFFWDNNIQKLTVGEANVYGIKHFAPQTQKSYQYKISIVKCPSLTSCDPYSVYSSKTFFVKVT